MFGLRSLEPFWVDVALQNPLDTEVALTNLAPVVEAKGQDTPWINEHVIISPLKEVVLRAKENRTVRIQKAHGPRGLI